MICSSKTILQSLTLHDPLILEPESCASIVGSTLPKRLSGNPYIYNFETFLKARLQAMQLRVKQYAHPAFLVRANGDPTRWSPGALPSTVYQ